MVNQVPIEKTDEVIE